MTIHDERVAANGRSKYYLFDNLLGTTMGLISSSLSAKDMARLCHSLHTLYAGGVPLERGLGAIAEGHGHGALSSVARDLRQAIQSGATLSQAVHFHRKRLSPVFVNLIAVADHAGGLDAVLQQLAGYYEDLRRLYNAVVRQAAYPAAVLVAMLVLVPMVIAFLSDAAGVAEEPLGNTLLAIGLNAGLRMGGVLLAVVAGARLTLAFTTRESVLMHAWPLAGIVRRMLIARFSWSMMVCLRAGMPMHHAVRLSGQVTGAKRIADDFERLAPLLTEGFTLEQTLAQSKFLPKSAIVYVNTGEATGKLDACFEHLSRGLYDEALFRLRILVGLIEPLGILFLGGLVSMSIG